MWYALALIAAGVWTFLQSDKFKNKAGEPDFGAIAVRFGFLLVPLLVLAGVLDAVVIVPAGHRAVVFDSVKGVKPVALKEGINFVTPFIQDAINMDVRVQALEYRAGAASKDMQSVIAKVTVNVYPEPDDVARLYKEVGINYGEKVIHPAVQEALKASTAKYTAEQLISQREHVKADIHKMLSAILTPYNIHLRETYITDFDFSKAFTEAIESKQVADQEAQKATRDLTRIKVEAEQQIAKARAEAETLRMKQMAVTPLLIQLNRVAALQTMATKWDGKLPTVMMGGAMPLMDMKELMGSK